MPISIKSIAVGGCLASVVATMAACSPHPIAPVTVNDLMQDRVMLDGVLLKCNKDPSRAHYDADCANARIAIDRLASQTEPAEEAKRAAEFERARERLRLAQEKQRRAQEAKTKVDAYHLPLVPVEPTPPPASPPSQVPPAPAETPQVGASLPPARQANN